MRALLSPTATDWQPSCHRREVTSGMGSIVPKCHLQRTLPLRMLRGHAVLPVPWVLQDTGVQMMLTVVGMARMPHSLRPAWGRGCLTGAAGSSGR